jgi:hypothetical protein
MVYVPTEDLRPASFKDLFLQHYDRIRAVCEEFEEQGLALVAIDQMGVAATACVAAKPDQINTAIIGRHGQADLFLDGDPSLSLRHLVLILHPRQEGEDLRFRLLDLRTQLSFEDENGRRLEALEAEGPMFVRSGIFAIFFLPTGDELPWPDDPQAGWECIPERIFFDDEPAEPDRWERRRLRARLGGDQPRPAASRRRGATTRVQTFRGPSLARRRLVEEDEEPLGELRFNSSEGSTAITIGRRAATEGILVGRYERCDTEGLPVLSNIGISRVHLLLVEIDNQLYAIDTASTNGVFYQKEEARVVQLEYDQELVIGDNLASIRWCVLN